jgi:rhodanese-related sulfurtransferase
VLALIIGAGLAGCGSGSRAGADSLAAFPDGAPSLPDSAAVGAEAAAPADTSYASDAAVSPDLPVAAVEVANPSADVAADSPTAPLDGTTSSDRPLVAPDAGPAEAAVRMDAELPGGPDAVGIEAVVRTDAADASSSPDAVEAAKPADAAPVDTAKPATDLAPATLGEISAQQLHTALANKDFLLIDVHYPNAGSIPGTEARIAFDDIPALVAFIGPNLDTKVVLTCLSGHMSKTAGDALVARGYRNISELTGGMSAWTAAGYTLVRLDGGM